MRSAVKKVVEVWYETRDGDRYRKPKDASRADDMNDQAHYLSSLLEPRDEDGMRHGAGYVQQDPVTVRRVRRDIGRLVDPVDDRLLTCHISWLVRWADEEMAPRGLANLIHRLYCMDTDFREWEQPYFALNPGTGQPVRLDKAPDASANIEQHGTGFRSACSACGWRSDVQPTRTSAACRAIGHTCMAGPK